MVDVGSIVIYRSKYILWFDYNHKLLILDYNGILIIRRKITTLRKQKAIELKEVLQLTW